MNKEKFHIPMPDDEIIQREINTIVKAGMRRKESFHSYILNFYRQIGFRYLFTHPLEGILVMLSVMAIMIFLSFMAAESIHINDNEIHTLIFLISPLLFMSLSIYDFFKKSQNATLEVEMVAKYNVYQMSAFRMLNFSMISIIGNSVCIAFFVMMSATIDFFRIFMISTTALFLFSVIFLIVFMKGRSVLAAVGVGGGWIGFNLLIKYLSNQVYFDFLETLPIFVYGLVLISSLFIYFIYLSKLVRMKPAEGVF